MFLALTWTFIWPHQTFRSPLHQRKINHHTYLVTTGSAAWLGPHLPRSPLPIIPVLPTGFLWGKRIAISYDWARNSISIQINQCKTLSILQLHYHIIKTSFGYFSQGLSSRKACYCQSLLHFLKHIETESNATPPKWGSSIPLCETQPCKNIWPFHISQIISKTLSPSCKIQDNQVELKFYFSSSWPVLERPS